MKWRLININGQYYSCRSYTIDGKLALAYVSGMAFLKLVNTVTHYDMPEEYSEYGLDFFFV